MYFTIACFPDCTVKNFEMNLTFLKKQLSYMTKKSRENLNLQNEKSFYGEINF